MNIKELQTFLELADHPNYQTVSDGLNYAPSTLNRHIRLLEEELGAALFHKQGRNVFLTKAGELFLPRARRIVGEYEAACSELAGKPQQASLRIGGCEVTLTRGMVDILSGFAARYPDIHLNTTTSSNAQVPELLRNGTNEVGFYYSETDPSSGELKAVPLFREQKHHIVVAADHPLAGRKKLHYEDLAGQEFAFPHISCYAVASLLRTLEDRGVCIKAVSGLGVLSLAIDQVRTAGMAMIAPFSAARKMAEKDGLRVLDLDETIPVFTGWIVSRADVQSEALDKLIAFSRDYADKCIRDYPNWYLKA